VPGPSLCIYAGTLLAAAWAQEPAGVVVHAAPPPAETSAGLLEAELSNGLRVTIVSDPMLTHEAVVIRVGVGSAHEAADEHGLAHMVEHLMFAGTERYPREAWWDLQDGLGATSNAFTRRDDTTYHTVLPPLGVGTVLEMEADRLANFDVQHEQLERERGVVLDELRLRYGMEPHARLGVRLQRELLGEHPYGRPVGGEAAAVDALDIAAVTAFHERHYGARNVHLVLVGPLAAVPLLLRIEALYGALPAGQRPTPPPPLAAIDMARRIDVGDPTLRTRENGLVWQLPPDRICAEGEDRSDCDQAYWAGQIMLALLRGEGSATIQVRMARIIGGGVPVTLDVWRSDQGGLVTLYARRHRGVPLAMYQFGAIMGALVGVVLPIKGQPTFYRMETAVRGADTDWIDEQAIDEVRASVRRHELARSWDPLARALAIAAGTERGATELSERLDGLEAVSASAVLQLYQDWFLDVPGVRVHVR